MQDPFFDKMYLIVGRAATILELSLILPELLNGTLKSTLMKTFFPEKEMFLIDFMII
jgi:hypothetical protein